MSVWYWMNKKKWYYTTKLGVDQFNVYERQSNIFVGTIWKRLADSRWVSTVGRGYSNVDFATFEEAVNFLREADRTPRTKKEMEHHNG